MRQFDVQRKTKSPLWVGSDIIRLKLSTDLVKLDPELSSTLQRGGEGVEVLTPEGEEFLYA